jgi:hypothetical protein
MIAAALHADPVVTLASDGDGGGAALFGLVLFAAPFVIGWFVYTTLYRRYRNQNARYLFEHTTSAKRSNLQRWDTFTRAKNRQRSSTIDGRNDDEPLERTAHSVVREAVEPRRAQEERLAQEARMAQEPRNAQEAREASPEREADAPRASGAEQTSGDGSDGRPPA